MSARPSLGQDLIWRLEALGYDIATFLFRLLPVNWASALGGKLLRLVGPLTSTHRTARINIDLVFPEMSPADKAKLLADQWENVGRAFFELPILDRIMADPSRIELIGGERLQEIIASDKPVVFVSGHFSNWEVMPLTIVQSGVVCQMTYRAANNPYVDARIKASRARYGVRLSGPN